jgi:hypothetical protein
VSPPSSWTALADDGSARRRRWEARRGCPRQSPGVSRQRGFRRVRSRRAAVRPCSFSRPAVDPLLSVTDADGRCMTLLPARDSEGANPAQFQIAAGIYKIVFKPQAYFEKTGRKCFYPWVEVVNTRSPLFLADRPSTDPIPGRKSRRALSHSPLDQPVLVHHI